MTPHALPLSSTKLMQKFCPQRSEPLGANGKPNACLGMLGAMPNGYKQSSPSQPCSAPWAPRQHARTPGQNGGVPLLGGNAGHCRVPTPGGSIVSPPDSHARKPDPHYGQHLWGSA